MSLGYERYPQYLTSEMSFLTCYVLLVRRTERLYRDHVSETYTPLFNCNMAAWKKIIKKIFILIFKINFNWSLITLQYRSGFAAHWHESAVGVHVSCCHKPPSHLLPHSIPLGCPSAPDESALFYASNLDWSSILYMVIYMFQCYFLKSSHPHLLPQSPKICSLHLCLSCYLAYRVIITIFLNSICMH